MAEPTPVIPSAARNPLALTQRPLERFHVWCSGRWVAAVADVIAAFGRCEGVECLPQKRPESLDRPLAGGSKQVLELGKGQFDRIEVGAVRRQVAQFGAGGLDGGLHRGAFVR